MLVYPSSIDLSSRTLRFLTGQLTAKRRKIGTRWRRLSASRQALLALAHLRCGDTYAQLAAGFGIGIATVYRYIREAVDALSAIAPSLTEAMRTIRSKAFVILLPIDRIAADTPYYSGKRHGMNVEVLTDQFGRLLWASPTLPGSTHDLTAARHHGIIEALADAGTQMPGGQGVSRSRRTRPGAVTGPPPQEMEAPPQHHPRQDPLPGRAGNGHPQGVAPPAETPLQHQPSHRRIEGRHGLPRRPPHPGHLPLVRPLNNSRLRGGDILPADRSRRGRARGPVQRRTRTLPRPCHRT